MRGIENYMKAYLKAFSFVFLYIFIGAILVNIFKINAVIATTISNVFMILLYYILKHFYKKERSRKERLKFDKTLIFFITCFFLGFIISQAFSVGLLNNGIGVKEVSDSITKIDPIFYLFFVVFIAPFGEEIIFRGLFFETLIKRDINFYLSLFTQAVAFSLLHGAGFKIPATFSLGLLVGLIYYYYDNIYYAFFVHSLSNLYIVTSPNNTLVLKLASLNIYFVGFLFLLFIILFFIFSNKLYKKNKPLG